MTTPQGQLYALERQIRELVNLFKAEDDEASIFERIDQIEHFLSDVSKSQENIVSLLELIIKLLVSKK